MFSIMSQTILIHVTQPKKKSFDHQFSAITEGRWLSLCFLITICTSSSFYHPYISSRMIHYPNQNPL